jgi:hypothetical protein
MASHHISNLLLIVVSFGETGRNITSNEIFQVRTKHMSLSKTLYFVVILYMFRASSVHLQETLN